LLEFVDAPPDQRGRQLLLECLDLEADAAVEVFDLSSEALLPILGGLGCLPFVRA
jgi:hypothetical protein